MEKKRTWKMELKATSPAQYSLSPEARSFPHDDHGKCTGRDPIRDKSDHVLLMTR